MCCVTRGCAYACVRVECVIVFVLVFLCVFVLLFVFVYVCFVSVLCVCL